jgi:hypothetical protein
LEFLRDDLSFLLPLSSKMSNPHHKSLMNQHHKSRSMPTLPSPSLPRENSLEYEFGTTDEEFNLPPGRMHATRVKERLSGSSLTIPPGLSTILRKRVSSDGQRSRSISPSMTKDGRITAGTTTTTTLDGNSSISSFDDIVDQDILYDREGFVDLDLVESQRKMHSSKEWVNLPPVNERMTEDTLEDVHAFSDAPRSSNASRANSMAGSMGTGQDGVLEALDECEEEEDDLSEAEEPVSQVILTNMENLAMEQEEESGDHGAGSLQEEVSVPTV